MRTQTFFDALVVLDDAIDTNLSPQILINELIESGLYKEIYQINKISVIRRTTS